MTNPARPAVIDRWHHVIETNDAAFRSPAVEWNDQDRITGFKVVIRPIRSLQALMPCMAAQLGPA